MACIIKCIHFAPDFSSRRGGEEEHTLRKNVILSGPRGSRCFHLCAYLTGEDGGWNSAFIHLSG